MLEWLGQLFSKFGAMLVDVLPTSPFQPYIQAISDLPYLSYLNWFVPVGAFITILETWLSAILIFYLYSIILRWIKAIGD